MTRTLSLDLPTPPSTNNLFANVKGKGRVPTAAYSRWKDRAGWEAKTQRAAPVPGPVSVRIACGRMSQSSDIDNRIKAALDLLVALHLIDDDRDVREVTALWDPDVEPGRCRVTVQSWAGAEAHLGGPAQ